jgi:hypothetical protein
LPGTDVVAYRLPLVSDEEKRFIKTSALGLATPSSELNSWYDAPVVAATVKRPAAQGTKGGGPPNKRRGRGRTGHAGLGWPRPAPAPAPTVNLAQKVKIFFKLKIGGDNCSGWSPLRRLLLSLCLCVCYIY